MIKRKSNLFIRSFVKICFHVTAAEEQRGQTKSRTRVNEEHRASKNYKCFHLAFSSLGSSNYPKKLASKLRSSDAKGFILTFNDRM